MNRSHLQIYPIQILFTLTLIGNPISAQEPQDVEVTIDTEETYRTMTGFGASLAYYEGWLTAHPKKNEIYEAIFNELSLDILRVRNAYGYDAGMVGRVKEFAQAAKASLGHPIAILSTSWGPPAYLKSNNDKSNGGTLRYTAGEEGVIFDYAGFADWWVESLDEYNRNGIYPDYIGIQNEPDFSASWESCRLNPSETINATDTIAGFNRALDSVYHRILQREHQPKILGPENVGIGYNSVENYGNAMDLSKIYGIAHHLYHGVNESNPFASTDFKKVGNFHPEIPHFQSEYSRGDWFYLAGVIYMSLHEENVTAYLYWDLIWVDGAGLVSLEFPWDPSGWTDPQKGYARTKDFFAFKQYSAFIHPGWQRAGEIVSDNSIKGVAFLSPGKDSGAFVAINRSETETFNLHLSVPGYSINTSSVFRTSATEDCDNIGGLADSIFTLPPHSVATVAMQLSKISAGPYPEHLAAPEGAFASVSNFPNPFPHATTLRFYLRDSGPVRLTLFDSSGREVRKLSLGSRETGIQEHKLQCDGLENGLYFYRLEHASGDSVKGKFIIE
ncbi:MAG: T9SS type A sorting domain-containing protein [Bacteroidales bacterium]|nr:T9SS type A sorting domain-containing protein [Bacteroidales bacterium]MBN2697469.1 T9SS type A sorting domain-containing protein [Bacteroidales bacterium]